jgi:hypothetical protein
LRVRCDCRSAPGQINPVGVAQRDIQLSMKQASSLTSSRPIEGYTRAREYQIRTGVAARL